METGLEYIAGFGGGVGAGTLTGCCAMIGLIFDCKIDELMRTRTFSNKIEDDLFYI